MPSNNNTANGGGRRSAASKAPVDSTYGHLQPQALELERVVLGALMIDKDAFTVVSEILRPDTFYEPRNQKVYTAIQTLNMAEKPVDIMTVTEELRHEGELQNIGGPGYIVELSSHVASSAHIEYHARILQQKYLARQLISFASMVETEAFDETVDVDALMQKAEGGLFELSQRNMMQDYTQIDPVIKQAHDILLKAANNTGGLTGVPTGYTKLDEMTAGWQQSDLIIIAGRPAMGKTSFALSIAKNIAIDYRKPVAFFSLEMNNVQLINRLISNVCEVPGSKILSGQLSEDEWVRFDKRLPQMQGAPLYVDDTPGLSVFELRTKARRLKREHDIQLLMIDYLQLMTGNQDTKGNREQEVAFISRTLKAIAKELNVPMIALSQLSRATEMRGGSKRPQLSDLRESGAIEQDADIVAFIHRPEYYGINQDENGMPTAGMAEIILAKHRNGAVCDVNLRFLKEQARFADVEDSMLPPAQAAESQQAYDDYASGSNSQPGTSGLGAAMGGEFDVNRSTKIDDEAPF